MPLWVFTKVAESDYFLAEDVKFLPINKWKMLLFVIANKGLSKIPIISSL